MCSTARVLIFLFFFRGWGKARAVISVATIITYLVVPISVMCCGVRRPIARPPGCGCRIARARAYGVSLLATLCCSGALASYGEIMLLLILRCRLYFTIKPRGNWATSGASCALLVAVGLFSSPYDSIVGRQQGIEGHDYIHYGWDSCVSHWRRSPFISGECASGWRTRPSSRGGRTRGNGRGKNLALDYTSISLAFWSSRR